MENSLKQRIVGAVVLIALAVIFLPAILKEKEQQEPFISKIPPKPIETMPRELPEDVVAKNKKVQGSLDELENQQGIIKDFENEANLDLTEVDNITTAITPTKDVNLAQTEIEIKNKISSDKQSSTDDLAETIGGDFQQAAWIIQIASFSNKENAVSFVEKLRKAGHKTYRQDLLNAEKKPLYRVYTGPYIRKEDAVKALKNVNEVSNLNGIVLLFDPTKP